MTVTREEWQRVKNVFDAAIEHPTAAWPSFVAKACAGDEGLGRRVKKLLTAHRGANSFLQQPASVLLDLHPSIDPPPVSSIGPYRVSKVLGRGGMGVVYAGTHETTGLRAAIKTVEAARADRVVQIRREIESLARLRHPGIVRILDYGVDRGRPWYAMDLVEHPTLEELRRNKSLPLPQTLGLLQRLCETLAYVHGEGMLHRDLKPGNIFVTEDGLPLLADFGLAANVGVASDREILDDTRVGGSISYMAPEQMAGDLLDPRTDLYAVGRILKEMVKAAPAGPAGLEEQDPPYEELLGRLLAMNPQERIGYATDVAAALEGLGTQAPAWHSAAPPARIYLCRPPLVGRSAILDEIDAHPFVLVSGESGRGKTRVALEAARRASARGYHVVAGACAPDASPLHPLRPLLRTIADRCTELGIETAEGVIGDRGPVLATYEPALAHVPGQEGRPNPSPLSPAEARSRLFRYLSDSISAHTEGVRTIVVLDDLHWADELTLEFLEYQAARLDPAQARGPIHEMPLLLIGTYRSEERSERLRTLADSKHAFSVELSKISPPDIETMIGGMLSLSASPPGFVRFLANRSEGNPYFVTEYLRMAVTEQVLARNALGRWTFADTPDPTEAVCEAMPLPQSLRDVIDRRLQSLSPVARRVMTCATVIGREFDADIVRATERLSQRDFDTSLAELIDRHVIEPAGREGFHFAHDKLREIPYAEIPDAERRGLHGQVAAAMEQHYRDPAQLERIHAGLGHHWASAGEPARAVPHLHKAGDRAAKLQALHEAIALYRAAVINIDASKACEDELLIREKLADSLALSGAHGDARTELERALTRSDEGAHVDRARLHRKIGKTLENSRDHAGALEHYTIAERVLAELADLPPSPDGGGLPGTAGATSEWVQIQLNRLSTYYWQNRADEMTALIDRLEPYIQAPGLALQRYHYCQVVFSRNCRTNRYGVSDETLDYARQGLAAAQDAQAPVETANGLFSLGLALLLAGRLEDAEIELRNGLLACRRSGNVVNEVRSLAYLGLLLRRAQRIDEARALAGEALAAAIAAKMMDYAAIAQATIGWVAWKRGDHDDARRRCKAALESWNHPAFPFPFEWMARLVLLAAQPNTTPLHEPVQLVDVLLDSSQMRLPDPIEDAIREAVVAHQREDADATRAALRRTLDESARFSLL